MEPREVQTDEGITWSCNQALSGISEEAGQVKGTDDLYWVVCTPSGGARSVRLQLPGNWETDYSDTELLEAIATAQAASPLQT